MPECWYDLLSERMKVEEERMKLWGWIEGGGLVKAGYLAQSQRA